MKTIKIIQQKTKESNKKQHKKNPPGERGDCQPNYMIPHKTKKVN